VEQNDKRGSANQPKERAKRGRPPQKRNADDEECDIQIFLGDGGTPDLELFRSCVVFPGEFALKAEML
jgi:hypothetical protein